MTSLLNTVEDVFARDTCERFGNKPDQLLEILRAVQLEKGYLSDGALRTIAQAVNISRAEIHGIVSFYHDYKRQAPADLVIKVCRAEACQAVGAEALISEAEMAFGVKLDGGAQETALQAAYCLGNCALGPAVMIEDRLYGRVTLARLRQLVDQHGGTKS